MGQKIAMIDTENGSGELYAHLGEYDVLTLHEPFTVQKYTDAIDLAEREGYQVLIIDSLSHAWAAAGGLLDKKDTLDTRGGSNRFTNWGSITKEYENFKARILQSPIHIIGCMRSKMEYVQEENERGQKSVRKVGLAPIMRDGIEYEFTTIFDIDMNHGAVTSKDRTGLFEGHSKPLTENDGRRYMQWLESGAEPTPQADDAERAASHAAPSEPAAQPAQEAALERDTWNRLNAALHHYGGQKGLDHEALHDLGVGMIRATGTAGALKVNSLSDLTEKNMESLERFVRTKTVAELQNALTLAREALYPQPAAEAIAPSSSANADDSPDPMPAGRVSAPGSWVATNGADATYNRETEADAKDVPPETPAEPAKPEPRRATRGKAATEKGRIEDRRWGHV
jgi:hypothetical protein